MRILDDLDAACARSIERLNRRLGQKVRHARKAVQREVDHAHILMMNWDADWKEWRDGVTVIYDAREANATNQSKARPAEVGGEAG